jgi:4-hydroxy-tetrahydrodipicolinate synthase
VAEREPLQLRGIWAAVVTPIDASLTPDAAKATAYYRALLERGCDGVNLFGTTGEAMSFSAQQRRQLMESIAQSGMPLHRVMVGTGSASLEETVALTRCALDLGFAATLLIPPFFYRDASDEGVLRYFDALFARAAMPSGKAILYNFPLMSGITFRPDLVDRLIAEFATAIVGLKDSSNDLKLQVELHARHPHLAILPGSEHYLPDALAAGASGCISGSVALWPELAQSVYRDRRSQDAECLSALRSALTGFPFIAAVRDRIALDQSEETWRSPMPPLVPLTQSQRIELDRRLSALERRSVSS